ncbi:type II toxin-antitoxin system RelE/ParE family toxin [Methylocaldum sp. RMAD-M]|jgi:plasmid stabilization system protein ParE|uniref:type II toxin-antitoxin system RelE/ParE family toxin n=1 Tax=Methylocaldum sp. RMAD-M TaxID=2806557 RepID=UPI001AE59BF4|nr:type II toxin-antitoxin system RelE/ParE family toxin [Methylocaldum sp. RMAD-M]MBP1152555.1 plasmid stabilization system protein ParE [Methylocaldum sp. RMAD-M]
MPGLRAPTLKWSPAAQRDVVRLREFIEPHNPDAARRAAESLKKAAKLLMTHPGIGKRLEGRDDRELFVPFGQRGYVIRYRLDGDDIVILRIWHSLEDR